MLTTRQELFDTAIGGLRSQGGPSIKIREGASVSHACLYRNADGRKCAIGWLIPDDKYHKDMEFTYFAHIIDVIGPGLQAERPFLDDLQSVHDAPFRDHDKPDDAQWTVAMEINAQKFAEKYSLRYTPAT